MDASVFRSFVRAAIQDQCDQDMPANYLLVKTAIAKKFPLLTKSAAIPGNWSNALEIGGLGVLAAPAASSLAGHPWQERNKDIAEVGGLGILAAPYIHNSVAARSPRYAASAIGQKLTRAFGH